MGRPVPEFRMNAFCDQMLADILTVNHHDFVRQFELSEIWSQFIVNKVALRLNVILCRDEAGFHEGRVIFRLGEELKPF